MSIKLKLIKGLSYRGGKDGTLKATKDKPFCFVETMEEAQAAIASGYFQLVNEPKVNESEKPSDPDNIKSISKMSKDELEAYAAEKGIDISGCKNNDERKEAIKKALEEATADDGAPKVPFQEE